MAKNWSEMSFDEKLASVRSGQSGNIQSGGGKIKASTYGLHTKQGELQEMQELYDRTKIKPIPLHTTPKKNFNIPMPADASQASSQSGMPENTPWFLKPVWGFKNIVDAGLDTAPGKFIDRAATYADKTMLMDRGEDWLGEPIPTTGNKIADIASEFAGTAAGFIGPAPGGGFVAPAIGKVTRAFVPTTSKMAENVIEGAGIGGTHALSDSLANNDTMGQTALNVGTEVLGGALFDAGGHLAWDKALKPAGKYLGGKISPAFQKLKALFGEQGVNVSDETIDRIAREIDPDFYASEGGTVYDKDQFGADYQAGNEGLYPVSVSQADNFNVPNIENPIPKAPTNPYEPPKQLPAFTPRETNFYGSEAGTLYGKGDVNPAYQAGNEGLYPAPVDSFGQFEQMLKDITPQVKAEIEATYIPGHKLTGAQLEAITRDVATKAGYDFDGLRAGANMKPATPDKMILVEGQALSPEQKQLNMLDDEIKSMSGYLDGINKDASNVAKDAKGEGDIYGYVKSRGGIRPSESVRGEYNESIPLGLKNNNGAVLDELAQELGMDSRQLLDALNNPKSSGLFNAENDPQVKAIRKTLENMMAERDELAGKINAPRVGRNKVVPEVKAETGARVVPEAERGTAKVVDAEPQVKVIPEEPVKAESKKVTASLDNTIQRKIDSAAFEYAMDKMGYKTLRDKEIGEKKLTNRSQFDVWEEQEKQRLSNDEKFIQSISEDFSKKQADINRQKDIEESFSKEDWQVPREIILNRGSQYKDGKHVGDLHKETIQQALAEGKPVPEEVLADYPELTTSKDAQTAEVGAESTKPAEQVETPAEVKVETEKAKETVKGEVKPEPAKTEKKNPWEMTEEEYFENRMVQDGFHKGAQGEYTKVNSDDRFIEWKADNPQLAIRKESLAREHQKLVREHNAEGVSMAEAFKRLEADIKKPSPEPAEEIIGKGRQTGEVIRKGDFVYKSAKNIHGKQTNEGEIYKLVEGVEGFAQGTVEGDKIKIPYYDKVISIDEIPKEKRSQVANIIRKNMQRINKTVSEMSNRNIMYSDPLQFGVTKDGKMDLLDFSNARVVKRSVLDNPENDNFGLLQSFYRTFGLDKQADIIGEGMRYKSYIEDGYLRDKDLQEFLKGEELSHLKELGKYGDNLSGNNVYYTTNAREVQLKGIAQTEDIDGYKLIFSEKPLPKEQLSEYELKPIYEDGSAPVKADKAEVKPEPDNVETVSAEKKSPWEMTKEELLAEKKLLEDSADTDYWKFSHSPSAKVGPGNTDLARLNEIKAALGEKKLPWQRRYEVLNKVQPMSRETHKKYVEQAIADGKPVPEEVLTDYPELVKTESTSPAIGNKKQQEAINKLVSRMDGKGIEVTEKSVNPDGLVYVKAKNDRRNFKFTIFADGQVRSGILGRPAEINVKETPWLTDAPYTQAQIDRYNHLTQFPKDLEKTNASFAKSVKENEEYALSRLKKYGVDEMPVEVRDALDKLREKEYKYFLETIRSREAAPPWNVTGRSNYKGNPDRAEKILRNAGEEYEKAKALLKKRIEQYSPKKAISSDDADAVTKLEKKISDAEALQERMKSANTIIRSKKLSNDEKVAKLVEAGFTENSAKEALEPDYAGRPGFPQYMLQNNNANIKRMKERLGTLVKQRSDTAKELTFEGGSILDNVEANRVQIFFDEKPDEAMRKKLKDNGFRFSPNNNNAWQRMRSDRALRVAQDLTGAKEEIAAAGKEMVATVEPLKDNYLKDIAEYSPKIYRETNADSALEFIPGSGTFADLKGETYFANTADMAKGQGTNKGVLLEFDSNGVQGQVNTSKPGWEIAHQNGSTEFIAKHNDAKTYQDNLVSVTVQKGAEGSRPSIVKLKRTLAKWEKVVNEDGSTTYFNPEKKVGIKDDSTGILSSKGERVESVPKTLKKSTNIGYHAGDLGKAEHLARFHGSNRGTGHFGTGTYFVGDKSAIDLGSYKDRPLQEISFDGYNLYRPESSKRAEQLHEGLKFINDSTNRYKPGMTLDELFKKQADGVPDYKAEAYQDRFRDLFTIFYRDFDVEEFSPYRKGQEFFEKAVAPVLNKVHAEVNGNGIEWAFKKDDSASTRFMKSLGYEGIDVRGIKGFDNTQYGSVIYNLKKGAESITDKILTGLDNAEQAAKDRLASRKGRLLSGVPLDDITDHAIIGAVKIARGSIKFSKWAREMVKDFGDSVRPVLRKIYEEAKRIHESWTKHESFPIPKQEITSAGTSINASKMPRTFKMIEFETGTINADIGGGRFDNVTDFLAEKNVKNVVWDPFNRSIEHNAKASEMIRDGKADTATVNNVLNVINTPENRAEVIQNAANAIKPDGKAYFLIYTGNGSGVGSATSKGWQENRKAVTYLSEIRKYFAEVKTKGDLIVASKPVKNGVMSTLENLESTIKERIKKNSARLNSNPADMLGDYALLGAVKIAKGTVKFSQWAGEMVKEYGDKIRPHLRDIYAKAKELHGKYVNGDKATVNMIDGMGKKAGAQADNASMAGAKAGASTGATSGNTASTAKNTTTNTTANTARQSSANSTNTINNNQNIGDADSFRDKISREAKDPKTPLNEKIDQIRTQFEDSLIPLESLEKSVRGEIVSADDSLYKTARLFKGSPEKAHEILRTKLNPVIEEIENAGYSYQDLGDYALAVHAKDVNAKGINSGFTDAEINSVISKYGTSEMESARKKLVKLSNELLDDLTDSGRISEEAVQAMKEKWPNYMPLFRSFDDAKIEFGKGISEAFANVSNPIKQLKGSDRKAIDPIENMIKNVFKITNTADRSRVGGQLLKLADEDAAGEFVRRLNPGEEVGRKNVLNIYENGEKVQVEVQPDVYKSMLDMDKETSSLLIEILSKPAGVLRAGATLTPEFAMRNPMRDVVNAFIVSESGFNPVLDFPVGLAQAIFKGKKINILGKEFNTPGDLYHEFLMSNGGYGNIVSMDRKVHRDALESALKKPAGKNFINVLNPKTWLEVLRAISDTTETATKLGEFRAAKRSGATQQESAYRARDLMDFARAGTGIKQANRIIAFLNANIQGKSKMLRAIKKDPAGVTARALLAVTLPTIGVYVAQKKLANDIQRQNIEDAPDWLRDTFWLVPVPGTNQVARIPKPFDFAPIFSNSIERFMDYMVEKDPKAFDGFIGRTLSDFSVPVMLTGLTPFIEGMANYSFFRKAPIIPKREEGLRYRDQKDINTTETAKLIAAGVEKLTGGEGTFKNFSSPRVIDNTIIGTTAGLGRYATNAVDMILEGVGAVDKPNKATKPISQKPVLRAFLVNENASGKSVDEVYEIRDRLTREKGSARLNKESFKNGADLRKATAATKRISIISKRIRQIENSQSLSADKKRDLIKELSARRNDIARKAMEGMKDQ